MPLEKWEIDLRKQLGDQTAPSKGDNWEENLMKEIEAIPKKIETQNYWFEMALLIFLGIAIIIAYDSKKDGVVQNFVTSLFSKEYFSTESNSPSNLPLNKALSVNDQIASLKDDLQKMDSDINAKLEKLSEASIQQKNKIHLMGVMLNENFCIVRNNKSKKDMIFFNRDWTLDKMPSNIELAPEDKEYLKKFVK